MGALNIGPAIYGATRGMQDAERSGMEREAFDTDQQIRKQQLQSEKEQAPLRRRAAELNVESGEHALTRRPALEKRSDELADLGIDKERLTVDELKDVTKEAKDARQKRSVLMNGLASFNATGDPSSVSQALTTIYPGRGDAKATRNGDGTISIHGADGAEVRKFSGKKWEDGSTMTPDDEFAAFVYSAMDPVGAFQQKWKHAQTQAVEGTKTDRAMLAAGVRADGTVAAAGARGALNDTRRSDAWYNRQHGQIKGVLDSMLKTTGTPGSFIAGYAHENDAALRGKMEELVENEIESNGTPVRQAANNVVNDVRKGYDVLDKKAKGHAVALAKAKIKPTDRDAVTKAAQAGNEDAKELLKTLQVAEKNLGPSIAKYLESQLPTK